MGSAFSSTTTNPSDSPSADSAIPSDSQKPDSPPNSENSRMSDSNSKTLDPKSETPESNTLENPASAEPLDPSIGTTLTPEEEKVQEELEQSEKEVPENGEEGEEEGECGFCLFMKGGGCRESFIAWENCVEEAEKNKEDLVEKCSEVTGALKKCMEAHADYYEPILRAEKMAEEEVVKELEMEKEKEKETEKEASSGGSDLNTGLDSKVSEKIEAF
jgi:intermembrane space import and assembly protein 40